MLAANLVLRPIAQRVNREPVEKDEHEILYRLRCTCRTADEVNIRTMLTQTAGRTPLTLIALHSLDEEVLARVNVKAYLKSIGRQEEALEQMVTRLSLETGVTAVSWEVVAAVDSEDASITATEELVRDSSPGQPSGRCGLRILQNSANNTKAKFTRQSPVRRFSQGSHQDPSGLADGTEFANSAEVSLNSPLRGILCE